MDLEEVAEEVEIEEGVGPLEVEVPVSPLLLLVCWGITPLECERFLKIKSTSLC